MRRGTSSPPVTAPTPPAVLTVATPPTADAGSGQTSCGTNYNILNGSVGGGATGGQWSTSGTGSFQPDNTTLTASYCPSALVFKRAALRLTLTSTRAA